MIKYEGKAPGVGNAPNIEVITTLEQGEVAAQIDNAIGIVGVALRGPLKATYITSPAYCVGIFGEPHNNNCAIQAALTCLGSSNQVWFKRVVSKNAKQGVTWEDPTTDGTGVKPWAVFTTKELTEVFNNYKISLTWENDGTEDEPKWVVNYIVYDTKGNNVESYRCYELSSDGACVSDVVTKYSNYFTVEITGEPSEEIRASGLTLVVSGGNSGLDVTADDIVGEGNSGMKAFYDPEAIGISTLIVPGWSDEKVWKEGIDIGNYRKDIMYIPSLPAGLTPTKVRDLIKGHGEYFPIGRKFNQTFTALYWPNGLKWNDAKNGYDVVDIAPYIAATYAKSDKASNVWTAPAGVKRGTISGLDGLEYETTREERDMLYHEELSVNSVVNMRGYGPTIMGARTSKIYQPTDTNTALRYVNIRRLCNYARKVALAESVNNLFDPNDPFTWNDWRMRIEPYFRTIKDTRGVYDYKVIMDETTVTPEHITRGQMPGIIKLAPTRPNEYIIINFVVAKDGTIEFTDDTQVESV